MASGRLRQPYTASTGRPVVRHRAAPLILAEQVRSVTVERIGKGIGQLPASLMAELDQALRIHLSL
jgi:mRNA-degrading endonuclease toxin of MazEF toxin-antitoxin module